jgi:hypothetical protein
LGKVKYLYRPLRRAFKILKAKISYYIDNETILQIAVKALNNTVGPNSIIPTLLVFRAYLQIL